MALLDFSAERRSVELGGRRYIVRRITVGAAVRFLTLYGKEIAGWKAMEEEKPGLFAKHGATLALMFLPPDERMLAVLRGCVESDEPESHWPLEDLAIEVAKLSDWPKLVASLDWSEDSGDPRDVEAENRAIVGVAKLIGVPPPDILDWPFEAWMATVDALGPEKPKAIDPDALATLLGVAGAQ